jgi:quercetin dioxygenase-like cupin family protein
MRKRVIGTIAATFLAIGLLGQAAVAKEGKASNATLLPAGDMKFSPVEGFPGLQMAVAEGDPAKGPSHFFIKFAAGFAAPLHHHTSDHHVAVLSGTLVLNVDGKDNKLGAGSYFTFNDKTKHTTRCDAGSDCLLFVDVRGPWDVVPEAEAAGKK